MRSGWFHRVTQCNFFGHIWCERRAQRDALGEAKASGNLGNTLKMLGRFDEATLFCERHLVISRKEGDKVRSFLLKSTQSNLIFSIENHCNLCYTIAALNDALRRLMSCTKTILDVLN